MLRENLGSTCLQETYTKATLKPCAKISWWNVYCVKIVQIQSFFLSIFFRIRTEYGQEKTLHLDIFHAAVRDSTTAIFQRNKKKLQQFL